MLLKKRLFIRNNKKKSTSKQNKRNKERKESVEKYISKVVVQFKLIKWQIIYYSNSVESFQCIEYKKIK